MPKQGLSSSVIEPEPAKSFKSWARSSSELQELLKSLMTRRSGSFQRKIWSAENLFPLDFWRKSFSRFFLRPFKFKKRVWKDEIGESLLISLGTEAEFLPHPPLRPLRWVPLRWKRIKCWVSTKNFSIKSVKSFPRCEQMPLSSGAIAYLRHNREFRVKIL